MIERILIVAFVALAIVAARGLLRIWHARHIRRAQHSGLPVELWQELPPGRPAVLAFSTPGCIQCRSLQLPAMEQLRARVQDQVAVLHFSAPEHPGLVSHFGILTVPATVVLDTAGEVRHVNLRYTSANQLQAQALPLTATPNIA